MCSLKNCLSALPKWVKNESALALGVLSITNWLAHFFYLSSLGLYEDDYGFIPDAMDRGLPYLLERLQFFTWWPEGRPVGFFLISLFAFIGDKVGGLAGIYLMGFLIVTLNSYLFYLVVKKLNFSNLTALMGAIVFCLFPIDTTKTLLTHSLILQPSLTFLLLFALCYLSNHRRFSYLLSLGSLLSYETVFLAYFGVPFLRSKGNQSFLKELSRHVTILVVLFISVALSRTLLGEGRVNNLKATGGWIPERIFTSLIIGPSTSLSQFVAAPLRLMGELNHPAILVFCIYFLVTLLLFYQLMNRSAERRFFSRVKYIKNINFTYLKSLKLLLVGTLLVYISYLLCFSPPTYPPTSEYGRLTSSHLATTFGGSLMFSGVTAFLIKIAYQKRVKLFISIILSLYLSTLLSYQFIVQQDYVRSGQYQRAFWTQVIANSPDLDATTTVLVVDKDLSTTKYIETHSWADIAVLKQLCFFPNNKRAPMMGEPTAWWKTPPILLLIPANWKEHVRVDGKKLFVPQSTISWWEDPAIVPESTILLEPTGEPLNGGHLQRVEQPVMLQGQSFTFKQSTSAQQPTWKEGVLFKYLIHKDQLPPERHRNKA